MKTTMNKIRTWFIRRSVEKRHAADARLRDRAAYLEGELELRMRIIDRGMESVPLSWITETTALAGELAVLKPKVVHLPQCGPLERNPPPPGP